MDYIQKDLELIRMASSNDSESSPGKTKQKSKKEKPMKKHRPLKEKDGSKAQPKPARLKAKTLSPAKLQKELKEMKRKEKAASRRSIGNIKNSPSLGKIKLPSVKKPAMAAQKEISVGTKRKLPAEPKAARSPAPSLKPEPAPKITTTPASSARSKKSLDPDAVPLEAIRFEEGAKIEAVDHGQWYKAKIVKVDQEKMDILVHFEGWGARFDTWFPMTSTLIRGRTQLDVKPDQPTYEDGEDVLARWTDGNFYPATILSVKASGSCMVMYFDGMKKLLRPNVMKKMSEKEKETAMKAAEKMLLLPPAVGSPQSSISAGSPSSADGASFRKYKTSANDRERRIAARSERGQEAKSTVVKKKAVKRKASERETVTSEVSPVGAGILPPGVASGRTSRRTSEDENFNAKKARLDRITDSLLDRVSPDSDSSSKKDVAQVEDVGASPKLASARDDAGSDSDSPLVIDEEKEAQPTKKRKLKKKSRAMDAGAGVRRPYSPQVQNEKDESLKGSGDRAGSAPPALTEEKQSSSPVPDPNAQEGEKNVESGTSTVPVTEVGSSSVPGSGVQKQATNAKPEDDNQAKNGEAPMKTEIQSEVQTTSAQSGEQGGTVSDRGLLELLPKTQPVYKKGDIVLAKWADCRSYLAYVLKKEDDENYKIRYYDGMVKIVKSSFIHPWVGPLPDALKSFKPKSPPKRKGRRASDSRQVQQKKSKEVPTSPKMRQTPRERTNSAPEQAKASRRRSRTSSEGMPLDIIQYHHGEKVLAKWTDLKWYPATVVGQTDHDHYKVRYHDDLTRIVRDTWLTPWKPPAQTGQTQDGANAATPAMTGQGAETEATSAEKPTASGEMAKVNGSTKENQPEEGSIIEAGEVVGLGEKSIKTYEKFNVDDAVLARWTDCRNYPATIRKVLDDGRYVVEYYDGMQRELKPAMLKSWNPSAMPPTIKPRKPRNAASNASAAGDVTAGKLRVTKLDRQAKKPGRLQPNQVQAGSMPRQVVRGYDAYYARLPAAAKDTLDSDHHKFKCRVPGCTKSFRKEDLLRQHHKYYHQQRYKLRDMETNAAPRRRSSKEDTRDLPRRRVSADYEAITKGLDTASHPLVTMQDVGIVQHGRGAKPPIDLYKKQQANDVSVSSVSSVLDSSSGVDDSKSQEGKGDKKGKSIEEQSTAASKTSQPATVEPKLTRRKRKRQSTEQSIEVKEEAKDVVATEEDTQEEEQSETVNEDVIRCTCGVEEEEGFMIQCDGCFTWQHGACVGVDQTKDDIDTAEASDETKGEGMDISEEETKSGTSNEGKTEDKKTARIGSDSDNSYICWVCRNPQNVRESKRYLYNNEFLSKGKLPSLSNLESSEPSRGVRDSKTFEVMMLAMHQLMDDVVKMQDTLHGIKQKIEVVASPEEHPLLKTWKDPDVATITDHSGKMEKLESNADAASKVINLEENNKVEDTVQDEMAETKSSETSQEGQSEDDPDINLNVTKPISGEADDQNVYETETVQPMVKTPESKSAGSAEDSVASTSDKASRKPKKRVPGRRGRSSSSDMSVAERETYINRCRENLLDHILELEKQLDHRLTKLEDFVSRIDSQEADGNEESGDMGKLQDDLTAVQKLLLYC